jgi:hypothetical protein
MIQNEINHTVGLSLMSSPYIARRSIEPRNTLSHSLANDHQMDNNSKETVALKKSNRNNSRNKQHTPKSNRRKIRNQQNKNNRNDEDQYVALGTKIMRLIIKIVSSCKQKKRVR